MDDSGNPKENLIYHSYIKQGDKEQISNYKRISLTNVDYRLLAHTLAERLQNVINSIVGTDQYAYIKKNRFIGTNIRLVVDIIDYFNTMNNSGILMTVDFLKAFDSVEWNLSNGLRQFTISLQPVLRIMVIDQIILIFPEEFGKDVLYQLFCFYFVLRV